MITAMLVIVAGICLLATLLPLVPVAHGLVRSFDFGRLQVIGLTVAVLLLAAITGARDQAVFAAVAMAAGALAIQLIYVLPFTPVWHRQTAEFTGSPADSAAVSLLVANVKQGNRDYDRVIELVRERKPDIAVFMETDEGWAKALRPCLEDFREKVERPQSNTYGMILASRHELRDCEVRFLLNEEVPSISAILSLAGGREVRIVALHPEPPLPTRDTFGRDAEILLVAKEAREERMPMIVTGDLNDVAWSRTTRRFLRISGLLDPRQGRGLYNSFDARRWYLRWPLDHIFHSRDFELVSIERLPFIGSDHFPMYYRFALVDTHRNDPPPGPSQEDIEETREVIEVEKNRDRPPVGTDWEET